MADTPKSRRRSFHRRIPILGSLGWNRRTLVIFIVLVGAVVGGRQYLQSRRPAGPQLQTAVVGRGDVREFVSATGPVHSLTTLALNFRQAGRLAEVYVKVGDRVAPGQPLARLETTALDAELAAAKASLDEALADYRKLLAGVRPEDEAVAQVAVETANTQVFWDQTSLETTQSTTAADLMVAKQEVDNALQELEDARANLAQVANSNAADLTVAQQEVDNAVVQLADANTSLERVQSSNLADIEAVRQEIQNASIEVQDTQAILNFTQSANAADIEVAQQDIAAANVELLNAQANLENIVIPQNEVDLVVAQASVQVATIKFNSAQRDLEAVETGPEAVAIANAQVALADAEANLAAVQQVVDAKIQVAQVQLQNAQAELESARFVQREVHRDKDATRSSEADADDRVVKAESKVKEAEINLIQVQADGAQQIAAAQQQVNDARANLATAQANLDQARRSAQTQVDTTQAELALEQANLESARIKAAGNTQDAQLQINQANISLQQAQAALRRAQAQADKSIQEAQKQLHQAQAAVANAQAKLVQTQRQGESSLQSAQESLHQAEASLRNAEARLKQTDAQAQSALQNAREQVNQANRSLLLTQVRFAQTQAQTSASLESARAQLALSQESLKSAQADYRKTIAPADENDLAAARARIENAIAALRQAEDSLNDATLRAPVAGTVAQVNGTIGEYIASSTTLTSPLTNPGEVPTGFILLTDLAGVEVIAQVNEIDIGRVRVGQRVEFTVDAFPDKRFTGTVVTVTPVGTTVSDVVNYNVEIVVDPTAVTLLPNMTANVDIILAEVTNVIVVPNRALRWRADRAFVEVVRDGMIEEVPVVVGLRGLIQTEILEGLAEGDVVVISRIEELTPREEAERQREAFEKFRDIQQGGQ